MPTLNWIGKEAVVNHHLQVPFHLLKDVPSLACGEPGDGNLIVQGDNLVALKALLPYYAGQVKCIYIDPPYNTGKENEGTGWLYNDSVNSPIIRDWLGKIVGKEAEDLSRHDKWLCMMFPRLQLLKKFLAPDGVIFISIDDIELPFLRIIMDELFPHAQAKNRLACFVWETDGNFDNQAKVKNCHEYVLAYSKCFEKFPAPPVIDLSVGKGSKLFRPEVRNTIVKNGPKNPVSPITLPIGFPADFQEGRITARTDKWPHYDIDVVIQNSKLASPVVAKSGWSSKAICEEFIVGGFQPVVDTKGQKTRFVITHTGAIEAVKIRTEAQSHVLSVIREVGSTQNTSEILSDMGIKFTFPKPVGLISYLSSIHLPDQEQRHMQLLN
jgi:adenine-specific DNA-methyltransferase